MTDPIPSPTATPLGVREFQQLIARTFGARDGARGIAVNTMWLVEEVGELARALRGVLRGDRDDANLAEEFADVLAWLSSLASLADIDLEAVASARYRHGCPRCAALPCACPPDVTPHANPNPR